MISFKKDYFSIVLLAVFFITPLLLCLEAIPDIIEQRDFVRSEVSKISKENFVQDTPERFLREIEDKGAKINRIAEMALAKNQDDEKLIKFLENLTGEKVKQEIKIDIANEIKQGDYFKVPIILTLETSLSDFSRYLYNLEKSEYYFTIDSIKIHRAEPSSGEEDEVALPRNVEAAGEEDAIKKNRPVEPKIIAAISAFIYIAGNTLSF